MAKDKQAAADYKICPSEFVKGSRYGKYLPPAFLDIEYSRAYLAGLRGAHHEHYVNMKTDWLRQHLIVSNMRK